MQSKISIVLLILIILYSCTLENKKQIIKKIDILNNNEINKNKVEKKNIVKVEKITTVINKQAPKIEKNLPIYVIGDSYFIETTKYIPQENYNYDETGLASFYDKQLHKVKTTNNEYNKVTELLARHKTLPLPSVVKITNLENGLSLIVRVNDRGPNNNARIIEVSRKVAQLLRFYKSKTAKVRIQILSDPSKQLKLVTQSISDPGFNDTIDSAPTEPVKITELIELEDEEILNNNDNYINEPIVLGLEEIKQNDLFVKISGFSSYKEIELLKKITKETYKITTEKNKEGYSIIFGPMLNNEADNLFQFLSTKGYKQSEIIIK